MVDSHSHKMPRHHHREGKRQPHDNRSACVGLHQHNVHLPANTSHIRHQSTSDLTPPSAALTHAAQIQGHSALYMLDATVYSCSAGAFAAYGILSNLNAGVLVTIAWLAVVKQTGLTPIDPGQVSLLRYGSSCVAPQQLCAL
jgi:hypothetical protein